MKKLPLISIKQTLDIAKKRMLHTPEPMFGMDVYDDVSINEDFVILEKNGKGVSIAPMRCNHYICILNLKGGSIRYINQNTYETSTHSMQLIVPGVIHSFKDMQDNGEFFIMLFHENFFTQDVSKLLRFHQDNQQSVNLNAVEFMTMKSLYEALDKEYKNKEVDYKEVAQHLLIQLLYLLRRKKMTFPKKEIKNRGQQIANDFLSLIEIHFVEYKSVKDYADILDITPKHLSETIKQNLGEPALSYIHKRIIKESQYLLCYTDLNINQIAATLKFENSSDFSRFFKRYEGLSPKEYRMTRK